MITIFACTWVKAWVRKHHESGSTSSALVQFGKSFSERSQMRAELNEQLFWASWSIRTVRPWRTDLIKQLPWASWSILYSSREKWTVSTVQLRELTKSTQAGDNIFSGLLQLHHKGYPMPSNAYQQAVTRAPWVLHKRRT